MSTGVAGYSRHEFLGELNEPQDNGSGVVTPAAQKAAARTNLGIDGFLGAPSVQELTASGAVAAATDVLKLNHATVVIAATMDAPLDKTVIIADTSASGTAAHTVTLTGGTWNGTNAVATLNAPGEQIMVYFNASGVGTVLMNIGAVAFSG